MHHMGAGLDLSGDGAYTRSSVVTATATSRCLEASTWAVNNHIGQWRNW